MKHIKDYFAIPDTMEQDKKACEEMGLHYYTPGEEILNVISHGTGIVFGIIGFIFMMLKSTTPMSYATSVLFTLGFLALYISSTVYHATQNRQKKCIMRRIDYCSVNLIVIACGTGISLLSGKVAGYAIYGACFGLTAITIALCIINFNKFRMVAFAMNFLIGGILFASYFITDFEMPDTAIAINLAGIVCVIIGAAIFGIHKLYVHFIFHLCTLFGPILFWAANYILLS